MNRSARLKTKLSDALLAEWVAAAPSSATNNVPSRKLE
jgi:hypothetical protein